MNLTIANVAGAVPQADLQAAVAAINMQVAEHFGPEWGVAAILTATELALNGDQVALGTLPDAIIYIGTSAQDPTTGLPSVFGYHATYHSHIPYGFVYLDICTQYGQDWSVILSHETLELLADPLATRTVQGVAPADSPVAGKIVAYDVEVCDPTQDDSYQIDTVSVSNFVTKRYFGLVGPSAATNYNGLPLDPFGLRPGGYFQYEDGTTAYEKNGPAVPPPRIAARKILGEYRRNGRRQKRLADQAPPPDTGAPAAPSPPADDPGGTALRQQTVAHDQTIRMLAYGVTAMFFVLLLALMTYGLFGVRIGDATATAPDGDVKNLLFTLFGVVATGWANIIGYYFGSSAGSAQKTQALNNALTNQSATPAS